MNRALLFIFAFAAAAILANPLTVSAVAFDYSTILKQGQEVSQTVLVRLSGSAMAAHFYGPADSGVAVGVLVTTPDVTSNMSSVIGSSTLSSTRAGYLAGNQLYIGQVWPAGGTELHPVLPARTSAGVDVGWIFDNVPESGAWFDPTPAKAYIFQTTDGLSNFTAVQLPSLAIVAGANGRYTISDTVKRTVAVEAGATHFFPINVNQPTISDIFPEFDGDNPIACPTFWPSIRQW